MTQPTPTEAEQRAASMARHPAGRRVMTRAVVTLAAAGMLAAAAPGIASAAPSPQSVQGQTCHRHPDLPQCVNQYDQDYRPSWSMVDPSVLRNGGKFTFWQRVRGLEKQLLWMF